MNRAPTLALPSRCPTFTMLLWLEEFRRKCMLSTMRSCENEYSSQSHILIIMIPHYSYVDCAQNLDYNSTSCKGLKICVGNATNYVTVIQKLFPASVVVIKASNAAAVQGLATGDCNVAGGDFSILSPTNVRGVGGYNGSYVMGTKKLSKEPFGLVSRQDDAQWSSFVYWVTSGLFYADEQNITQTTASRMPTTNLFGTGLSTFLRDSVGAVGSFAQVYDRNVQAEYHRSGLNLLNTGGPEVFGFSGLPTL